MRYKELVLLFLLATSIAVNAQSEQEIPKVTVGGALRFNYNYSDWKEGSKDRGGDFGFDVFRIDVDAAYKKIILDAEYRFYSKSSGGGMLKSGWLGYAFTPQDEIQIGLTRVPFGITPYNSNSYFFRLITMSDWKMTRIWGSNILIKILNGSTRLPSLRMRRSWILDLHLLCRTAGMHMM